MDNVISPNDAWAMLDTGNAIDDNSYRDFMSNEAAKEDNFFGVNSLAPNEAQMAVMSGHRLAPLYETTGTKPSNTSRMSERVPTNEAPKDTGRFKQILDNILNRVPAPAQPSPQVETPAPQPDVVQEPVTPIEKDSGDFDWSKFFETSSTPKTETTTTVQPTTEPQQTATQETPLSMRDRLAKSFNPEEYQMVSSAIDYSAQALEQANKIASVAAARGYDSNKFLERLNSVTPEQLVDMMQMYDKSAAPQEGQLGTMFKPTREIPGVSIAGAPSTIKTAPSPSIFGNSSPVVEWKI